ncbi:MAG: (d)CMP kinase [Acidobacteria bacterium]|nr:(d)CMP kinase [Acidobacteriota bacterium]
MGTSGSTEAISHGKVSSIPRNHLVIAIDGPAGAGKSTVGKMLAARLGALYIDTGAMYRAIAWLGLQAGVLHPGEHTIPLTQSQEQALTNLANTTQVRLTGDPFHLSVWANDEDVTTAIRTIEVTRYASVGSAVPGVRTAMVAQQRHMGATGSVVLDGRDIGTYVFPDASFKFFLDASVEIRSQRRYAELQAKGDRTPLDVIQAEVIERDHRDRTRAMAPLLQADDAIYIDTSGLPPEKVVEWMVTVISQAPWPPPEP